MLARMAIYLGHNTARRILESRLALQLEPAPGHVMTNPEVGKKAVRASILAGLGDEANLQQLSKNFYCHANEPLDLMTQSLSERRAWKGMKCHVHESRYPSGSFYLLEAGIYVASPALCLIQLAPRLSQIELIKQAMSFCGIYQLEGDHERLPYERKPLTTPKEILEYVDRAKGMQGAVMVRDAMKWVIPNSGSPMETRMVLPLYLARHLGGFGLPRPQMNAPIKLSEEAKRIAGKQFCFGDAVWKAPRRKPLDFEYQSREFHDKPEQYGSDYGRQLALQHDGYFIQFVTSAQLNDPSQLNELARLVASHTGIWLPKSVFNWDDARRKLNREIQS